MLSRQRIFFLPCRESIYALMAKLPWKHICFHGKGLLPWNHIYAIKAKVFCREIISMLLRQRFTALKAYMLWRQEAKNFFFAVKAYSTSKLFVSLLSCYGMVYRKICFHGNKSLPWKHIIWFHGNMLSRHNTCMPNFINFRLEMTKLQGVLFQIFALSTKNIYTNCKSGGGGSWISENCS